MRQAAKIVSMMSSRQEDLRHRLKLINEDIEEEEEMPSSHRQQQTNPSFVLLICSVSGLIFGAALEKGRVFEPHIIREQMLFTNFTMLKMFLAAGATSMLSFSLMSMVNNQLMDRVINDYLWALRNKTLVGTTVGAVILGAGMTIAGACPGMVLAQAGAVVPNAGITLFGGLLGCLLYAITDPLLPGFLRSKKSLQHSTADEVIHTPYSNLALPMAAMMGVVIAGVETYFPWYTQVEQSGSGIWGSRAWPPYIAGVIIGLLQLPIMLTVKDTLGSATAYCTVVSQLLIFRSLKRPLAYLQPYTKGIASWWQVFYVGGAILGAHLSARASDTLYTVEGVSPLAALSGGVLMLFGSRMAGGCTSGHGLSGMGLLMLLSFVAVPAMFAGGIGTAVFMKYGMGMDI